MRKNKQHIGRGIEHFRKKMGWSQRKLASKADVAHSTIAGIEREDFEPSLKTLKKISNALQVPISHLFLEIEYS